MARAGRAATLIAFLDTNVLIRHLTGDPPGQAARATARLRAEGPWLLTDLVVAECVFVLESFYGTPPAQASELLRAAILLPSVASLNTTILLRALELHETTQLHFVDSYLVAAAEVSDIGEILSFDRTIDRVPSVTRLEP